MAASTLTNKSIAESMHITAIKKFLMDLKVSFSANNNLSTYSRGQAAGEFLKFAFTPMYLTMILGFVMLTTSGRWDQIFLGAIKEFLQLTGLKLLIYIVSGIVATNLMFYKFVWIRRLCAFLLTPLSYITFCTIAVLNGVLWGLVLPASLDAGNLNPLYLTILLSGLSLIIAIGCFALCRIISPSACEESNSQSKAKKPWIRFCIGIALIFVTVKGLFYDEQWNELTPNECIKNTTSVTALKTFPMVLKIVFV